FGVVRADFVVILGENVGPELPVRRDEPSRHLLDRGEGEAARGKWRQGITFRQTRIDVPEPPVGEAQNFCRLRHLLPADRRHVLLHVAIPHKFRVQNRPALTPVAEMTRTLIPSATYFAIVAAPLLDSSSGWACTANMRKDTGETLPKVRNCSVVAIRATTYILT